MNQKQDLLHTIHEVTDNWDKPLDEVHDTPQIANAILAAGYRKPRTITTVEELDALPIGSVLHCAGDLTGEGYGNQTLIAATDLLGKPIWRNHWMGCYSDDLLDYYETVTVLHDPSDGAQ